MSKKDIVLFVNSVHAPTYSALRMYQQKTGIKFKPVVIVDAAIKDTIHKLNSQDHLAGNAQVVVADFDDVASVRHALKPFESRIAAVTSQFENSITELKKLIPYLPYLHTPTETSLDWATDKKPMRAAFNAYDPTLSPRSLHVADATKETIDAIEAVMDYPIIIKPSGLERSLLVAAVHDRAEFTKTLASTFREIKKAHSKWMKRLEPSVLVEELMQGDMYSVDTYVAPDGTCRHAPVIKVVTGRQVGFDDFFAYLQMSPAGLSAAETRKACDTAERACRALGLRSITAHTELMRTPKGWKIIEVGPRIGGYRHELYALSHGMNHIMNDVLNRAGLEPEIPAIAKGHAAIFKTYARQEGVLGSIKGLEIVKQLPSYVAMKLPYVPGDTLQFAHNNGDAVIEVTLCHHDARQLQADIERLEEVIDIYVKTPAPKAAVAARRSL